MEVWILSSNQTIVARTCTALIFSFSVFAATAATLDGPTCKDTLMGVSCWMRVTGAKVCHVWDDGGHHEVIIWSGSCADGFAVGKGRLNYIHYDGKPDHEQSGTLIRGKKTGPWIERYAQDFIFEGPYLDGAKHGRWVLHSPDKKIRAEGQFLNGRRHGRWIERGPLWLGRTFVNEGLYVNDRKHGHWIERWSSGFVASGAYANGKKNGYWIEQWSKGDVHRGSYMDGKKFGHWIQRHFNGGVRDGHYIDGKEYGRWTHRKPDGTMAKPLLGLAPELCEGTDTPQFHLLYREGKRHGHWKLCDIFDDGRLEAEGSYVDGKRHGHWKRYDAHGNVMEEGPYVHGWKHGQWIERKGDGTVLEGPFVNGKRHGSWVVRRGDSGAVLRGSLVSDKIHGRWLVNVTRRNLLCCLLAKWRLVNSE